MYIFVSAHSLFIRSRFKLKIKIKIKIKNQDSRSVALKIKFSRVESRSVTHDDARIQLAGSMRRTARAGD